jgi:hypothetical protein
LATGGCRGRPCSRSQVRCVTRPLAWSRFGIRSVGLPRNFRSGQIYFGVTHETT